MVKLADNLGVITAAKANSNQDAYTLAYLKRAFAQSAVLPAKVNRGMVRSAYAMLASLVEADHGQSLRPDLLGNPFDAPHNLGWYFGTQKAPGNVKQFAVDVAKNAVKVWSVAAAEFGGWRILAQSLVPGGQCAPLDVVAGEARKSARKLTAYSIGDVKAWTQPVKAANSALALGQFVEITLVAEPVRAINRRENGAHADYHGRIPLKPGRLPGLDSDND